MGHYISLLVGQTPTTSAWVVGQDGPDFEVAFTKDPKLGELMLFDATSAVVVKDGLPHRDLISDPTSAAARFRRRLPQAEAALAWDSSARRQLNAFGQFIAAIDWPYLRLDTLDYRIVLEEGDAFDRELDFVLSALDLPAIAKPGSLFGGGGRFTPAWERVLNFCLQPVERIYAADRSVLGWPICGTPYYDPNDWARLLGAYLPRRGALTIPHVKRAKASLNLMPEQEKYWLPLEAALRELALCYSDWMKPAELRPLDATKAADVARHIAEHAAPLIATLGRDQKRAARRLCRAMGFASIAEQIDAIRSRT